MVSRNERQLRFGQRSKVVWLTGLSGSGKSTLGLALERRLFGENFFPLLLDGDSIRTGINRDLGFSEQDRKENIRRIAEIARLFLQTGVIPIVSFISPSRESRQQAREIVGPTDFLEVYVKASLSVCESRDVKGLYKMARKGEIPGFTGVSQPYEEPENPDLMLATDQQSPEESLALLHAFVLHHVRLST